MFTLAMTVAALVSILRRSVPSSVSNHVCDRRVLADVAVCVRKEIEKAEEERET